MRIVASHRRIKILRFIQKKSPDGQELAKFHWGTIRATIDAGLIRPSGGRWILSREGERVLGMFSSANARELAVSRDPEKSGLFKRAAAGRR